MSGKQVQVKKRSGKLEPLDINKIHSVVVRACEGLSGVSPSAVELRSSVQFFDGIQTKQIHETMIRAAADLIDEQHPEYQYVAGRLVAHGIRKEVFGEYAPPTFAEHCSRVVDAGFYDAGWYNKYSQTELETIGKFVDHSRDDDFTYASMEQWRTKYLVRDRSSNKFFETPQFAYLAMGCAAFCDEPNNTRLAMIQNFYDATTRVSLPTPIMAGLRTPQKQFSSCVLIETDDSLDSINATASAIVKYVSQKAGIGIGLGRIRGVGSKIRNGDATHTGMIPFMKYFYSAVSSCSQGGVRKGSATAYYPIWHIEVQDLLVLKNNKGTEETRIRHMDYGVQLNKLFYQRLINGVNITLFSPNDLPEMYDAFFADQDLFTALYTAAENNPSIRKKTVSAIDLFSLLMTERKDTGRIYIQHVDHANTHSSFDQKLAPVRQSNLCAEINLPAKPLTHIDDEQGEIALCTLAAVNWAAYSKPEQMEDDCRMLVRFLDNILSYQDYPVKAAWTSTRKYRPLGIGVTNFAYWLAKHGFSYENPTRDMMTEIARWSQAWSSYLICASIDLAAERGPCDALNATKYGNGIVPIDTAALAAFDLFDKSVIDHDLWHGIRQALRKHGIRNATLMACMPCETSALVGNHTNGIEPIRSFVTTKKNKDMVVKQVAPGFPRHKSKYELMWDLKSPHGYLKNAAVLQIFMDQGISINTSYNPKFFENEEIPMSVLLKDLILSYQLGHKQLYYNNIHDGAGELSASGSSSDECSSCKL